MGKTPPPSPAKKGTVKKATRTPLVTKFAAPKHPQPHTIRLSGVGGSSTSTLAGVKTAKDRVNQFLVWIGYHKHNVDDLVEDELCDLKLWRQFGTFLSEHAPQMNSVIGVFLLLPNLYSLFSIFDCITDA